jgi:hypothetical protein
MDCGAAMHFAPFSMAIFRKTGLVLLQCPTTLLPAVRYDECAAGFDVFDATGRLSIPVTTRRL